MITCSNTTWSRTNGISAATGRGRIVNLHELPNRIRRDPESARGSFVLGYYDRVEDRVILVAFKEVSFPEEAPNTFQFADAGRGGGFTGCPSTASGRCTKTHNASGNGHATGNEAGILRPA